MIGFFVFVGLILLILLTLFIGSIVYLRAGSNKTRTAFSLFAILVLFMGLTLSYQINLPQWVDSSFYTLLRRISTEFYGILIGMLVSVLILVPMVVTGLFITRLDKKSVSEAEQVNRSGGSVKNRSAHEPQDLSRRDFFKKAAIAVPTLTILGGSGMAATSLGKPDLNNFELTYDKVPNYLKNYKIAQLSDTHIGPFYNMDDFRADLELVKREKPNRVVITGDILDSACYIPELCQELTKLHQEIPDGVDYILGNHEFRNLKAIVEAFSKLPIRFLRNEAILLSEGTAETDQPVYMLGVDYPRQQLKTEREEFLARSLRHIPKNAFTILLAHHPMFIEDAFEKNISLTLTGHTHGGQFNLFGISLLPMPWTFWRGLYQAENKYGYVSTGTGHWFPVRFNCNREISFFTFKEK